MRFWRPVFFPLNYTPVAGLAGLEPATFRLTVGRSTAELQPYKIGDVDGTRTRTSGREKPVCYSFSPPRHTMVGTAGFEPATSCFQGKRSSQAELHPEMAAPRRIELLTSALTTRRSSTEL